METAALSLRYNANWILANQTLASMLLVGALSAALLQGVTALVPIYVRDVSFQDPTNSRLHTLTPVWCSFFAGASISPKIIRLYGERKVAVWSLLMMSVSVMLLSVIKIVDGPLALISPLQLVNLFTDTDLSDSVLAAGLIAFPANLGSTMCLQSVQVYVNRTVPQEQQGGVFGLQSVQENVFSLAAILSLAYSRMSLDRNTSSFSLPSW